MTKLTLALRAIFLSALFVPIAFSCSNYLDFQEDIGNKNDDGEKTWQVSVLASNAEEGESVLADVPRAAAGSTVTLTASLGVGRRVALSADGVVITPSTISANGDTASFTMPGNAVAITATFSDIPPTLYAITVTPSAAASGESVTASVSEAAEGTTITLTASLGASRRVSLSADGIVITPSTISANGDTASFTMSGKAVAVAATFSDIPPTLYAVTVTPSGAASGESVTASVTQTMEGTNVTLTASLNAGRRVSLSADGVVITPATISADDGTATFTMPGNAVEVTATFYSVYAITITPSGAASGESVTASVAEAAEGTTITLTAALGAGRRVALSAAGVTITLATISADDGTANFTMPGNAVEVTATFSDIPPTLYAITVTPSGAASGESVTASVAEAAEGTTITLTAALGAGRRVALSADGVVITPATISTDDGTATFTMPGNAVEVTATFSDILYPITITPSGATGSEGVTASVSTAAQGTTITLTATLGASRRVALSAAGVTISFSTINTNNGTATFTMPGNAVAVTATFSDILYPITVTPSDATGSEVVTASVATAAQGTTITLTATLGASRRVALNAAGATITPSIISTDGDMVTFTMPANAVTVTAIFSSISAGYAQTHTVNGETFDTHYTPSGGTFIMGQNVVSPTQTVTLTKNFWMGETEVTQGLWEAVAGFWSGNTGLASSYGNGDNKPVYFVNWYDAVAFCNKVTIADDSIADSEQVYYSDAGFTTPYTSGTTVYADLSKKGYRLPTEAEWEYAARYINGTSWNHGNHASGDTEYACDSEASCSHVLASDARIGNYAWYKGNNSGSGGDPMYGTKDVGQIAANALGLRDMSGNVSEWCHDWYAEYSGGLKINPTGPTSGSRRVLRGGSWNSTSSSLCCAYRINNLLFTPTWRLSALIGFRLCRTAD